MTPAPEASTTNRPPRRPRQRPRSIAAPLVVTGLLALALWSGWQLLDAAWRAPAATDPVVEFFVENLDCPIWCAVRVTDAIDALDGAETVTWDPATGVVAVRHDPARQSVAGLSAILEDAGFPVLSTAAR